MTASEAIAKAKETRQGSASYSRHLERINVIEGRIQTEIMGKKAEEVTKYDEESDNVSLLVPHPYDELYVYYLCALTDHDNEEMELYGYDSQFFEECLENYRRYYGKNSSSEKNVIHGWWNS